MKMEDPFTAIHHALLFTSIAGPLIESAGLADGEQILRQAIRRYGQQRGHRMALRAEKNGHPLNLENYFAYGEWAVPKGQMQYSLAEKSPHARLIVARCPWYQIWESHGLLDIGKYFCKDIDAALLNGFNPDLTIDVESTRTNGGTHCDFLFKHSGLSPLGLVRLLYKKKVNPGAGAVMPWEYHCGHLFKTMREEIGKALGDQTKSIMDKGRKEFSSYFSGAHVSVLDRYLDTDFSCLP